MGEIFKREAASHTQSFTGERLTTESKGQIEIEHLHRYFVAREFCRGLDVLDIASGEGYGSAYLARIARSVVGVDIDEASVKHAACQYTAPNLTYRVGSAEHIPVESSSIDVVVSFETIEHLYAQDDFLTEVKRVIRPGGLFIASTPDRDIYSGREGGSNPFHLRELTRDDYRELLDRTFPHVHILFQKAMLGSAICSETSGGGRPLVIEKRGDRQFEASHGMARSTYMLSFASDAELPPLTTSLYVETGNIGESLTGYEAEIVRNRAADLKALADAQEIHLSAAHRELLDKDQQIEANRSALSTQASHLKASNEEIEGLRTSLERERAKTATVQGMSNQYHSVINHILDSIPIDLRQVHRLECFPPRVSNLPAGTLREEARALQRFTSLWAQVRRNADVQNPYHGRNRNPPPRPEGVRPSAVPSLPKTPNGSIGRRKRLSFRRFNRFIDVFFGLAKIRGWLRVGHKNVIGDAMVKAAAGDGSLFEVPWSDVARVFDAGFYADHNPDVNETAGIFIDHYLEYGWREGRDPSPLFNTDWYLSRRRDVAEAHINPLIHFLYSRGEDATDPHPLFDVKHYIHAAHRQDVELDVNALVHFLSVGAELGISPHPLFSIDFYIGQLDGIAIDIDPLSHYLRFGSSMGLWPNATFDPHFYLQTYPDVKDSGLEPLVHFSLYGEAEGRRPSASFDPPTYLHLYPDVAAAGISAVRHFISDGHREGRVGQPVKGISLSDLKPPGVIAPSLLPVSIVVPIYRGLDETRKCIDSLLESLPLNRTPTRLFLIDDFGPEPELSNYVRTLARDTRVIVIENPANLGFVASVNKGMSAAGLDDVILLNSDTEVHGDWIDRLASHAYAQADAATVTPFSNNATIYSYPTLGGTRDLPRNESVASLDNAFRAANCGRSIEIPTAVGFCMYICREALAELGLFDQERFGKGYGEENDFCLRAIKAGWKNLLAADTYVYHVGETSFGEQSTPGKARAAEILDLLYPDYIPSVRRFVQSSALQGVRAAATAARSRYGTRPIVLMVAHHLGGGTHKHIRELAIAIEPNIVSLMLEATQNASDCISLKLYSISSEPQFEYLFEAEDVEQAAEILSYFGICRIHIHHSFGVTELIQRLVGRMGVPYDLTVHDFYLVCPRINLLQPNKGYCGLAADSECMTCLASPPAAQTADIVWWRVQGSRMIRNAEKVICPSGSTAALLSRLVSRSYDVVYHDDADAEVAVDRLRPLASDEALQIGVIGVLAEHKGAQTVFEVLEECAGAPVRAELSIIGRVEPHYESRLANLKGLRHVTGAYAAEHVGSLIDFVDPHLIFYPQRWPETYSYTLSEGIRSRRPILAPAIGAFVERLAGRPWTWLYDPSLGTDEIAKILRTVRQALVSGHSPPVAGGTAMRHFLFDDFYQTVYVGAVKQSVGP